MPERLSAPEDNHDPAASSAAPRLGEDARDTLDQGTTGPIKAGEAAIASGVTRPASSGDRALRTVLFIAGLVIILAGVKAASALIVQVLLAAAIAIISWPLVALTKKIPRLPNAVGMLFVLTLIVGALIGIGFAVYASARGFVNDSGDYARRINDRYGILFQDFNERFGHLLPFEAEGFDLSQFEQFLNPGMIFSNLSKIINELSGTISTSVLVLVILSFILLEVSVLPRKLEAMDASASSRGRFDDIIAKIQTYILVKTGLSIGTAAMTGVATTLVGVPYPGIWMLLTFVLNFVPVFGSLIASIPPVILALIFGGLPGAIAVASTYMAANFIMDNVLEPRLMGYTLGLSPLIVFLALLFWGWLLGPIGMILSTPLTMSLKIMLDDSPQFHWASVLLGTGSVKDIEAHQKKAKPALTERLLRNASPTLDPPSSTDET